MAKASGRTGQAGATGANVGYEAQLWQMADALRGSMDAAEYKLVFIDARKLGRFVDRTHRELTDEEIARTHHAWHGERANPN